MVYDGITKQYCPPVWFQPITGLARMSCTFASTMRDILLYHTIHNYDFLPAFMTPVEILISRNFKK
jgi:hypothetical protein